MNKLEIIKHCLKQIINDIDTSNSHLTEEECDEVLSLINKVAIVENKYSKYQACKYLGISRATFDNYIKDGKIPEGKSQQGFKEKFWLLEDLKLAKTKLKCQKLK